jgi:hypothetical protein
MTVRLDNVSAYLVINDEQIRDPVYLDYIYNYINYVGKDEDCVLMTDEFRKQLLDLEVDLFMKNKENFKYDKNKKPNLPFCM